VIKPLTFCAEQSLLPLLFSCRCNMIHETLITGILLGSTRLIGR
jgi:hypothetical protein